VEEKDLEIINDITDQNLVMVPSSLLGKTKNLENIFIKADTTAIFSEYLKSILSLLAVSNSDDDE